MRNPTKFRQLMDAADEVFAEDDNIEPKTFYEKLNKVCAAKEMKGVNFGNSWRLHVSNVERDFNNNTIFQDNDSKRFAELQRKLNSNYCTSAATTGPSASQQKNANQIPKRNSRKRGRTAGPTVNAKRPKQKIVRFHISDDDEEMSGYVEDGAPPPSQSTTKKPGRTRTPSTKSTKDTVAPTKKNIAKPRSRTTVPSAKAKKDTFPSNHRFVIPNKFFNFGQLFAAESESRQSTRLPQNNNDAPRLLTPESSNDMAESLGSTEKTTKAVDVQVKSVAATQTEVADTTVPSIVPVETDHQPYEDTSENRDKEAETKMDTSDDGGFVPEHSSTFVTETSDMPSHESSSATDEKENAGASDFDVIAEILPTFNQSNYPSTNGAVSLENQQPNAEFQDTVAAAATIPPIPQQEDQRNMASVVDELHNFSIADDPNTTLNLFANLQPSNQPSTLQRLETFQNEVRDQIVQNAFTAQQQQNNLAAPDDFLQLLNNQLDVFKNVCDKQIQFLKTHHHKN